MSIFQAAAGVINSAQVGPPVITAAITDSTGTPSSLTGDGTIGDPWTASTTRAGLACFIEVTLTSDQEETYSYIFATDKILVTTVDAHNAACTIQSTNTDTGRKITFTSVSTGQTTDVWLSLSAIQT